MKLLENIPKYVEGERLRSYRADYVELLEKLLEKAIEQRDELVTNIEDSYRFKKELEKIVRDR